MTLLLIGFFVRLALASAPGNMFDIGVNQGWGKSAVHFGLAHSYEEQLNGNMLPNYAPFTVMLFTMMAYADETLLPLSMQDGHAYYLLIKLPAIAADLGAAILAFVLVRRWKSTNHGLVAAGTLALHPAIFYESSVWGQTDSIYAFFILACVWAYFDKQYFLAGMFMALSLMSKMQGIFVVPLFAVLFIRTSWYATLKAMAGGSLTLLIIFIPFIAEGNSARVLDVYTDSVGYYPIVSSAAYNMWWSLYGDAAGSMNDTETALWPFTYRQVGLILFGCSYLYALFIGWNWFKKTPKQESAIPVVLALSAFLAHTFFMLNTEMHERYLFPFTMLGVAMIFMSRKAALIYAGISALFLLNLLGWLPATFIDHGLYEEFPTLDVIVAVLQMVLLCHFVLLLWNIRKKNGWFSTLGGGIAKLLKKI